MHESKKIVTFKDGKYTDDVRLCVMELLSQNVAILQVEPVVRAVLKLCKMDCEWFPQHTQINEMLIESQSLSQVQLADTLTGLLLLRKQFRELDDYGAIVGVAVPLIWKNCMLSKNRYF